MTREELIEFIKENLGVKTRVSFESSGTKIVVETSLTLFDEEFTWDNDESFAE